MPNTQPSKHPLDEIDYELYTAVPPQFPDGTYKKITDKTRNQLKSLMLDLADEITHPDNGGYSSPPDYIIATELRDRINAL